MAKRNWSRSEANNDRKPHAAPMAVKVTRLGPNTHTVTVTVDREAVALAFASKSDRERSSFYQPPIVGKSICR